MRFLAIDDNEDDIELLKLHIEDLEWEEIHLSGCSDWNTAKSILDQGNIDLVFLDYCLGPSSGLEILINIVEEYKPHPPVIMLTGQGSEEIAVSAIKEGAEDYLVKGRLDPDTVEHAILNALEKGLLKKKILQQEQDLLEAERQRVMLESVGAACHHFAQPLTAMIGNLEMLSADPRLDEEKRKVYFKTCLAAASSMSEIMTRFQTIREYRTRPYSRQGDILDVGIDEVGSVKRPLSLATD